MEEDLKQLQEELESLLQNKQYSELRARMKDINAADIADIMDDMENEDSLKMFRILPKDMAADVFADLEMDDQQYIITSLSDKEASNIIDNLYADDATDLLEEMPANIVKKILASAHPDTRKDINHLLRYPDDSAGSLMTVEFVDLRAKMTVSEAIVRIRR
ncbi:MAG: magnesium transporter, partial [Lachnospiraceae bacterium]|nr:magnesium transporter [Lachnospiraceae bacterium]